MKTVPDKCPFCESPIIIHGGNPLRSEDGGFATYECKTSQDAKWDNDQFIRVGQSDVCRFREVIILKKQRDEARERIKRLEDAFKTQWFADAQAAKIRNQQERIKILEDALKETVSWIVDLANSGDAGFLDAEIMPEVIQARAALKSKEAKPCIKQLKTKSCIYCMKVECECSDFDVSADMGAKG